jgi:actin-binding LIM protein
MRVLVEQMQSQGPRARSPHMNNEEPISLSHYPDGRAPEENQGKVTPIERDDFPAPPYAFTRRRHWSEPGSSVRDSSVGSATPVESSSEEEEGAEVVDVKLDRTEQELRKIANGMGKVFLQELAVERERRKQSKHRLIDPRSAARTPTAKKEPHFRLRYDSPLNASPSRIADHLRPWDDVDAVDGSTSRRSNVTTPFLPHAPPAHLHPLRVVSPVNPIRPGYTQRAQTLPLR